MSIKKNGLAKKKKKGNSRNCMSFLTLDFFHRPTLEVSHDLLGKFLVRKNGRQKLVGMVTEVEAYVGIQDKACHATRGKTERNRVMFEEGGIWYVYFVYGMYWMLNIVTEKKEFPAAILIRGIQVKDQHFNGPGKLTRFLKINKNFNEMPALPQTGLWFEDQGIKIPSKNIRRGKRIGIGYAGIWKHKPWRFYLDLSPTVLEGAERRNK